jgi:hypothetical protein
MKQNIFLKGHTMGTSGGGATLTPHADSPVVTFTTTANWVNCGIEDMRIDGTDTVGSFTSADGIQVPANANESSGLYFRRVRILNMGRHGIYMLGNASNPLQNLIMERVHVSGCRGNALKMEGDIIEGVWIQSQFKNDLNTGSGTDPTNAAVYFVNDTNDLVKRQTFINCIMNGGDNVGTYTGPSIYVAIGRNLAWYNCDFEQAPNYFLLGLDGTATSIAENIIIQGCRFGASEGGTTPDDYIVNCERVDGLLFDQNVMSGAYNYGVRFKKTQVGNAPRKCRNIMIGNNNRWGSGPLTNAAVEDAPLYVIGSANANDGSSTDANTIRWFRNGDTVILDQAGTPENLTTINDQNGNTTDLIDGETIQLQAAGAGDNITITTAGNILLEHGSMFLTTVNDRLTLQWCQRAAKWIEVGRYPKLQSMYLAQIRVTETITTATDWSIGDASVAARFAAANSTLTAGTTSVGQVHRQADTTGAGAGPDQSAAAKLRITTTGTPGAGKILVTVFYQKFTAPSETPA